MADSTIARSGPRLERATPWWHWNNRTWGIAGTLLLGLVVALAWTNLQEVVRAEQDFVVGSLLSLVGFSYAKAWSPNVDQRAAQLLFDTNPPPIVKHAIDEAVARRLDRLKGSRNLALLADKLGTVSELLQVHRLNRQQGIEMSEHVEPVARASHHVAQMWPMLDDLRVLMGERTNETRRLVKIARDLEVSADRAREALARFESLEHRLTDDERDIFAVMQKDISGALQMLGVVQARAHNGLSVSLPPVHLYVEAALRRTEDFRRTRGRGLEEEPEVFRIMIDDLTNADKSLLELMAADSPDERHAVNA